MAREKRKIDIRNWRLQKRIRFGVFLTCLLMLVGQSKPPVSSEKQHDVVDTSEVFESSLAYTRDEVAEGQIRRLYRAYFNREPEKNGFNYWLRQLRQQKNLRVVSDSFASSQEFHARYGSLSNQQFVLQIYRNVLHRMPDASGERYWNSILDTDTTRGEVMLQFSESEEFIAKTQTTPPMYTPIAETHNVVLHSPRTYEEQRGMQALRHLSYPWQERLPSWTIEFQKTRSGYLGLTFTSEKKIVIYVRPNQSDKHLQHVIAHEIGHAIDVTHNSQKDRERWVQSRGLGSAPWWPKSGGVDFATGAGDFAESFADLSFGGTFFESRLAAPPSQEQKELLNELTYG